MIQSINPATGEVIARLEPHDGATVEAALDGAVAAQRRWQRAPLEQRTALLRRVAAELRRGKEDYARLITEEMGKPITEALGEIEKCAMTCEHYADHAPAMLAPQEIATEARLSGVVFEPLGVVLAVMPWNYPFWQFFRFAAPALAAGNGAILKHAGNVPRCALAIEEALRRADCPDGLVRTLLIDASAVAPLIEDRRIAAVTLTGSTEVGRIVAAQAGKALKKQVLELGGSDPFIVLGDADVERAADCAVRSRFINVGQSCVNAKRFIVEESVAEAFTEAFVAGTRALTIGDPMQPDTRIGPMARANLSADLHDQVRRSIEDGARLVFGGAPLDRPGFWYAPTVLDHCLPHHTCFREELFGPVASIARVSNADDAVRLANDTDFGLAATIWTGNTERGCAMAREIAAGAVFVNGMVASDPRLPFGGIRDSGYGRELGAYGLREFTNIKTLWVGS